MDTKRITKNSEETKRLGSEFAKLLKPGDTLLMYGDLGAGKTTFVQGLAEGLKISDRILSPTFVLQRIHKISSGKIKTLNHIDLYRLEGKQDIDSLGLNETVEEEQGITIIEWADRLSDFAPKQGYSLHFEYLGGDEREIKWTPN